MPVPAALPMTGRIHRCRATPNKTASAPPTRPIATIEVTTITPTCRGIMPIDLSTPISWTRSRVLSTTVLNTPSAATPASSRQRLDVGVRIGAAGQRDLEAAGRRALDEAGQPGRVHDDRVLPDAAERLADDVDAALTEFGADGDVIAYLGAGEPEHPRSGHGLVRAVVPAPGDQRVADPGGVPMVGADLQRLRGAGEVDLRLAHPHQPGGAGLGLDGRTDGGRVGGLGRGRDLGRDRAGPGSAGPGQLNTDLHGGRPAEGGLHPGQ